MKLPAELQALLADEFDLSLPGFGDGEIAKRRLRLEVCPGFAAFRSQASARQSLLASIADAFEPHARRG